MDQDKALIPRNMHIRYQSKDPDVLRPDIVLGITLHNLGNKLPRCLESVQRQVLEGRKLTILVLNDASTDELPLELCQQYPQMMIVDAVCGSAARARNAILDFVDANFPSARWVARLDADDVLSGPDSMLALVKAGEKKHARFVLGGNRLCLKGKLLEQVNKATDRLLDPDFVIGILNKMAEGTAENELPSCNLLLSTHSRWRYPDVASAEDHWLVADLLLNHPNEGVIVEDPFYSDYNLSGNVSLSNIQQRAYIKSRKALYAAASVWIKAKKEAKEVLGHGLEGLAIHTESSVEKWFYPGIMTEQEVQRLSGVLKGAGPLVPKPVWKRSESKWICSYPWFESTTVGNISAQEAKAFLKECLRNRIVCCNIKRDNFRKRKDGTLVFIDIGRWIISMDVDYFIDSAARLYAISVLGWPDEELLRRPSSLKQQEAMDKIPGFRQFYLEMMQEYANEQWKPFLPVLPMRVEKKNDDVTLLIRACAMDAEVLVDQVRHIVSHLEGPQSFHERVLLIDEHPGPFLRQYASANYPKLLEMATNLKEKGYIDRIIKAPTNISVIKKTNKDWFGLETDQTHTPQLIPVTSQVWAFDQVKTRYVLQCDIDILVGRHDIEHDYLKDMLKAVQTKDVLGVAFNIPHEKGAPFKEYTAPKGEYVPEVRCGLLDLHRVLACRPLPNSLLEGALTTSWFRSLQQYQQDKGLRTLRGGDSRTFYIHPPNACKGDLRGLARVRDLIGQGIVPKGQLDHWDLEGFPKDWAYPSRNEKLVFLVKGQNTPLDKVRRCIASLLMQTDQDFGVIVIDDASTEVDTLVYPHLLKDLRSRTTLIRWNEHRGRIPNMITAIREVCTDPESLIVCLDLDDALISRTVVEQLRVLYQDGHDIILGAMFRPDKPLKLYHPDFKEPRRNWGGNVWMHLRAFRKRLFDMLPDEELKIDGDWIPECTDYAIMIPMVEIASNPVFVPEYLYYHEKTVISTPEVRERKDWIIKRILEKGCTKYHKTISIS